MTNTAVSETSSRMRHCKPQRVSGNQLKEIYPELDGWASPLVTKAFVGWQRATGATVEEPEKRDERFPAFLRDVMLEKHRESRA
ncbi:hypothetical protein N7922_24780 (plasmid) [Kosakonia sp. ML.JS2a]|uniref:hypothetical protein n=1 Tax=Kosakonia sp. ML.JS2a TaxID=2980557 RepID=UPI0021DA1A0F|nr:hypothetical protein [Kosakonia sp. ML.JS2a]UXY13569.1 hypothetical protein N7922_24780 [Kosakonia sp. ML.JS2a]